MNLVIYRENASSSRWLVLVEDTHTPWNEQEQTFYRRFAECSSYEDATAIVRAMSVAVPA